MCCLFLSVPVTASQQIYELTESDCKIVVNGEQLKSDLPILNYEGYNYVPLGDVGRATGANVQWDGINRQVIIKSAKREIINFPNGDRYIGDIYDDKLSGYGIYTWANKDVYYGEWIDGNRTGHGTYYFCNGSIYIGEFLNGDLHGYGTYISADNVVVKGIWKNNQLQGDIEQSTNANEPIIKNSNNNEYKIKYPLRLYSDEKKRVYLGKLVTNEFDSESIYNEFGNYGSKFSTKSIWNEFSDYGSEFSLYSAFNEFASHPPLIVDDDGVIVGRLTTNDSIIGAINPNDLKQLLVNLGQ